MTRSNTVVSLARAMLVSSQESVKLGGVRIILDEFSTIEGLLYAAWEETATSQLLLRYHAVAWSHYTLTSRVRFCFATLFLNNISPRGSRLTHKRSKMCRLVFCRRDLWRQ